MHTPARTHACNQTTVQYDNVIVSAVRNAQYYGERAEQANAGRVDNIRAGKQRREKVLAMPRAGLKRKTQVVNARHCTIIIIIVLGVS